MTPLGADRTDDGADHAAVLVVDDNADKRLAIRAMLAPLGHAVVEADSGRAALRTVLRQTFAVILLDVRMPSMDGYETADLIRQRRRSKPTPIIFVTAFAPDETETAAAYARGAVDFIFTPIVAEVLRAKVAAFVDLFAQAQALQRSVDSVTALNAALYDSELRARAVLQNVADGIVTAGEGGLIESFNRSARRIFGYHDDEVVGKPLQMIIAPSHRDEYSGPARARPLAANDVVGEPTETVGCRKDGSSFAMEMGISRMQIGDRALSILCVRDISGRKAYTQALEHRTLHDDLTGLPNRTLFADRVDRSIAAGDRAGESRGVLLVALDDFREIPELLDRQLGDGLLREVADRLRAAMPDSATLGRLDTREFGILPSGETDVTAATVVAWSVREALEEPFVVAGRAIAVGASIGIALFPEHGRATADLVRRADLATHDARRGGTGVAVFVSEPEDRTARRLKLLNELRECIPRGELVLHYQPKIDLATRRTVAVEALVRWQHPTDGLLMPAQFMDEAERSELIEPLTSWVLDEALHQQRRWRDAGIDLTMAVNISARSLNRESNLADTVARLTERWGTVPDRLILELTERAMIDAEVPEVLDLLHAMGERLAIDDFGTGHSSLIYLQRLPIDQIKIDRSFVTNLASAPSDAVIVRSTIDLAHNLGLTVVAEGVEDRGALELLAEYGADTAQGYFFSRPRPAADLTTWLRDSPFGATAATISR
ncbi:MAG TPA: EAL domain-containing protein [Baekduia sp.]|nr:EAL domain-containing protein [Baekduia sp.]